MRFAGLQDDCNVVTGDQDFVISGTQTPIGYIATFSSAVTSGTAVAGSIIGWSIGDGTTSISGSAFSQDLSAISSDTGGRSSAAAALNIVLPTGTGQDGLASFVSFLNSGGNVGVRVNWSNAPATGLIVNWIFIFADTAGEAVHVGSHTTPATQNDENDYTSAPFAPNVALFFTPALGTTYNGLRAAVGFACRGFDGAILQACSSVFETDAATPTDPSQFMGIHTVCAGIVGGAQQRVTGWLSNGVRFQTLIASASSVLNFMLLKTQGRAWIGTVIDGIGVNTTGDKDIPVNIPDTTDPGFPAETVFAIGTKIPIDLDAQVITDSDAGKLSWGFGTLRTGTPQNLCSSIMIEDNVAAGSQETRSVVDTALLRVIDEDLGDAYKLSLTATLPNGFRVNVANENLTEDRLQVFLALSRPGGVPTDWIPNRRYFFRQSIRM